MWDIELKYNISNREKGYAIYLDLLIYVDKFFIYKIFLNKIHKKIIFLMIRWYCVSLEKVDNKNNVEFIAMKYWTSPEKCSLEKRLTTRLHLAENVCVQVWITNRNQNRKLLELTYYHVFIFTV